MGNWIQNNRNWDIFGRIVRYVAYDDDDECACLMSILQWRRSHIETALHILCDALKDGSMDGGYSLRIRSIWPEWTQDWCAKGKALYGMLQLNQLKVHISSLIVTAQSLIGLGWFASLATLLAVVFLNYPLQQIEHHSVPLIDGLYDSLSRLTWPMALSFIVFACHFGYGGPIDWLLSLPQWQPISRLTYAIYLMHMPTILLVVAQTRTAASFSHMTAVSMLVQCACMGTVWELSASSIFFSFAVASFPWLRIDDHFHLILAVIGLWITGAGAGETAIPQRRVEAAKNRSKVEARSYT